jgi:hypothetical protein
VAVAQYAPLDIDEHPPRWNGTCYNEGGSSIEYNNYGASWSQNATVGGCPYYFHVHAYFWGSDSQYHYDEENTSVLAAVVNFHYWTNDVYGYHNYDGYMPYMESHATY